MQQDKAGNRRTGAEGGGPASAALAAAVVALFAILYAGPFAALVRMWWGSDDYTHGFLVPLIALYIVWRKGPELLETEAAPAIKSGALLMALAGAMLVAGKAGSILVLQELSIPLMIGALVLLLAGPAFLKALWFPIAYLLFMVKIFGDGPERFHWPFQLLAADIGVWVLQAVGIPAYKEVQFIQLPNIMLEVAAACSGLRFLVSIIAIGIPLAWLTQRSWTRRVGLLAFAILIAVLANGARVALIGVWAFYGGSVVHGPMHVFQGMFVAWVGFIALFAGAWFLSRRGGPQRTEPPGPGVLARGLFSRISSSSRWQRACLAASAMLVATGVLYFGHGTAPAGPTMPLERLPAQLGGWTATGEDASDDYLVAADGTEEFARVYAKDGRSFRVYVSYYGEQAQGSEMVNYRNSWRLHRDERPVPVVYGGGASANAVMLRRQDDRRFAMFWYQMGGRTFTSRTRVKIWTVWKALSERRTNGALVIISVPDPAGADIAALEREAADLAAAVMPALTGFMDSKTDAEL